MKLTDTEKEHIRIFFKQIFNNLVITDKINQIDSKSFFKKLIDTQDNFTTIKELKKGICKPVLVLDSCGLIKLKYFSSNDATKKINIHDKILIAYDTFETWYDTNEREINLFLISHAKTDLLKYELISYFFTNNIDSLLTS